MEDFLHMPEALRTPFKLLTSLAIGLLLCLLVFLFFVKFLNVGLPAGWLAPILGTAGA